MAKERLQKILARAGFGARRKCEKLIAEGRVSVNGGIVDTPGARADIEEDVVEVDGKPVRIEFSSVHIMLNKPSGCLSAAEDTNRNRPTVMDYLKEVPEKIFHVGRLDFDTEGLLLFTNDGDFCQRVTHPSHNIYKTYEAVVKDVPDESALEKLRVGIELDDGLAAPAEVSILETREELVGRKNKPNHPPETLQASVLKIRIHEGRKRQVRRMFGAIGHPVIRLKRTKIGNLELGNLPSGEWRRLAPEEVTLALFEEEPADE